MESSDAEVDDVITESVTDLNDSVKAATKNKSARSRKPSQQSDRDTPQSDGKPSVADDENKDSPLASSRKKSTANTAAPAPPKLPSIKAASVHNISLVTNKDEKEEDDEDDSDDYVVEDEKKLKHAKTLPVLPLDRGEQGFPKKHVEEREHSFLKKDTSILLQEIQEIRPSTAKRRASITVKNLAKDAEADLKHSWLLEEQNRELWKKFEERKRQLTIAVTDENSLSVIEKRMEELRQMSKPRKDTRHVLDRLAETQKQTVLVRMPTLWAVPYNDP